MRTSFILVFIAWIALSPGALSAQDSAGGVGSSGSGESSSSGESDSAGDGESARAPSGEDAPARAAADERSRSAASRELQVALDDDRTLDAASVVRWVALWTSGAVLLSGAIFFGVGESELDNVEDTPPGTPWEGEVEEEYDSANDKIVLGIVGMVVGGVATLGALTWIILSDEETGSPEEAAVDLGLGVGTVALRGRFE